MTLSRDIAENARAWPFEEARKVVKRLNGATPAKGYALFETGYGPSGLPHIGTFGEVARTTMVRRAFAALSDIPTRLIAFSDDMDGLRKVPDNVPNGAMLRAHLNKPLTQVPDPFGCCESFGHHNNAELRRFLDAFGFDYEFRSATTEYRAGAFDATLLRALRAYDAIMNVMLPTLGEERRATYSPFMPICPDTGHVLQVPTLARDVEAGTIVYENAAGRRVETPVTGGAVKLQWKADWAMRWVALDVDYEMNGKDLTPTVALSSKIAKLLGGRAPEGFSYELFLDEQGRKISKSKGNGLTIDEWLTYATPESLACYMFQKPRAAKKLYFDVIPKAADDYLAFLDRLGDQTPEKQAENPAWHVHGGAPPTERAPVSFSMLLNLAAAANAQTPDVLWGFLARYAPEATPQSHPTLDRLVGYAIRYGRDFVTKRHRAPDAAERAALASLRDALAAADAAAETDADALQAIVFDVGRRHFPDPAKKGPDGGPGVALTWFETLYQTLLGLPRGPRMGTFIALYGCSAMIALIDAALEGALAAPVSGNA